MKMNLKINAGVMIMLLFLGGCKVSSNGKMIKRMQNRWGNPYTSQYTQVQNQQSQNMSFQNQQSQYKYQQKRQPQHAYQQNHQPENTYQQKRQPQHAYQQNHQSENTYQQKRQPQDTYQQNHQPKYTYEQNQQSQNMSLQNQQSQYMYYQNQQQFVIQQQSMQVFQQQQQLSQLKTGQCNQNQEQFLVNNQIQPPQLKNDISVMNSELLNNTPITTSPMYSNGTVTSVSRILNNNKNSSETFPKDNPPQLLYSTVLESKTICTNNSQGNLRKPPKLNIKNRPTKSKYEKNKSKNKRNNFNPKRRDNTRYSQNLRNNNNRFTSNRKNKNRRNNQTAKKEKRELKDSKTKGKETTTKVGNQKEGVKKVIESPQKKKRFSSKEEKSTDSGLIIRKPVLNNSEPPKKSKPSIRMSKRYLQNELRKRQKRNSLKTQKKKIRKFKTPKLDEEAKRKLKEEREIKRKIDIFFYRSNKLLQSRAMTKFFSIMKFKNKHFFLGAKDALSKQENIEENVFRNYCLKEMERMLGNDNFGEKELNEFLGLICVFLSEIRLITIVDIDHEDVNLPFFKELKNVVDSHKDNIKDEVYKRLNKLQTDLLHERKVLFESFKSLGNELRNNIMS